MIRIKKGVDLDGLCSEMWDSVSIVEACFGEDVITITSGLEGDHKEGSLHYKGLALDFRTRHLTAKKKKLVLRRCQEFLEGAYDSVLEATHLHIEYDPKIV